MNLQASVSESTDGREAERPESLIGVTGKLVMFWAEHTLPMPRAIEITAEVPCIDLLYSSREALDAWYAVLGPRFDGDPVQMQAYSHNGSDETLHSASSSRWGWSIYLTAKTPNASTEEPERTLTAVEDHAEPVPYDATVEDRHEHGFTFREGLGYLPDVAECPGCCELATEKWKAAWRRPVTDAAEVSDDMADKAAEAEEL